MSHNEPAPHPTLTAEHDDHSASQRPEQSKRQQKLDARLLRSLQGAVSDIEVAQTDLILAIRKRDNLIAELIARGVDYSTIATHTAMSSMSLAMIDAMKNQQPDA